MPPATRTLAQDHLDAAVVIALGSSLAGTFPTSEALLEAAVERLSRALRLIVRSSWWRSAAWPDSAQPAFINGVLLAAQPAGDPAALMRRLADLEWAFGRRGGEPNAPRTLDLDLIAYGREVAAGPALILPHPRAHQRFFVMGPLAEAAPGWMHPSLGRTAAELAPEAMIGADAHPLGHAALHNDGRNVI